MLTANRALFLQKWTGFVSAIWLTTFAGCYVFPNYSTTLKETLGINQKLLNGLAIAEDVGDSIGGLVAGVLSNYVPVWTLFCISAFVSILGYGIEWLVVSQTIEPLPYYVMFLAAATGGSTFCWMNVALFNTAVRSFARNRGPVAGLLKAHMGLSSAVFVAFCSTLFSNSASAYLLMLVTIPSTFSLISAIFFQPVPAAKTKQEEQAEERSLHTFNIMACMLALYIALITFLPAHLKEGSVNKVIEMACLLAILGAPALVPLVLLSKVKEVESLDYNYNEIKRANEDFNSNHNQVVRLYEDVAVDTDGEDEKSSEDSNVSHNQVVRSFEEVEVDADGDDNESLHPLDDQDCNNFVDKAVLNGSEIMASNQSLLDTRANAQKRNFLSMVPDDRCCGRIFSWSFWSFEELGEDNSTLSLLKTWHFYPLYFSFFSGCGSAMAFSGNLGQVGQSLGYSNANLFASLFSLGNFFGRLASGIISEYFLRAMGLPRPAWMALTKIPMVLMFLCLSAGMKVSLYVGSLVIGFCHGSFVTLSIPIIGEFYGLHHFSTNMTLISTYFLTGGCFFSSLAGYLYDLETKAEGTGGSLTCLGSKCYGTTFQIFAAFLTIGFLGDAILTLISRHVYQRLQASHNHLEKKSKFSSCT